MIPLLDVGLRLIERLIPDPAAKAEAQRKLIELQQTGQLAEIEAATKVVVAEAQSEHPLTSQWRPITMLTFTAIVANNYILYPYLRLFWADAPMLEMPEQLWNLLQIGIGGYVVGRTAEKVVGTWASGKNPAA